MENINSYMISYMDTLEKAEVTALIHHIARFLKSGIPINNSKVPDKVDRKTRRRTQTIAKCFAFHECNDYIVLQFFIYAIFF